MVASNGGPALHNFPARRDLPNMPVSRGLFNIIGRKGVKYLPPDTTCVFTVGWPKGEEA
jgi:hypothetical protein